MPSTKALAKTLLDRAVRVVEEAPNLDKAVARLAGVLYPVFFPRRVDVGLRVSHDRLVICGVWSASHTRLTKGSVLRTGATGFPDLLEQPGVVMSANIPTVPCGEALKQEGIHAWIAVPIPSNRVIEGGLGVAARTDVFKGHEEFFALLGGETGERLAELARQSEPYRQERESVLVLNRSRPDENLRLTDG